MDIFTRLSREDWFTIVVTTHNPELGAQASRTIHLEDGRIVG